MREKEYKQQMVTKCLIDMDIAISSLIGLGMPKKTISERASLLLCKVNGPKKSEYDYLPPLEREKDPGSGCV